MREANIACRAMGYGSAKSVQIRASYGQGVGKIHYSRLRLVVLQRVDLYWIREFRESYYHIIIIITK